jgi:antitoxin component of MazEF toxin-antitoxin module
VIKAKFEGGKLPIPADIIRKVGLRDGDEVEVGLEEGKVIIRPITAIAQFKKELKGCVQRSAISPLEVKKIWKA